MPGDGHDARAPSRARRAPPAVAEVASKVVLVGGCRVRLALEWLS
jgi:hypothetical protein